MLTRAALRAARSSNLRLAPTAPLRYYASSHNSRSSPQDTAKEYKEKYDWHTSSSFVQQKPGVSSLATGGRSKSTKSSDFSSRRPEVDSKATPKRNTAPKRADDPPVHSSVSHTGKESAEPEISKQQEEFTGPESPKANETARSKTGPLPDLRYGIPSTFAKEFGEKTYKEPAGQFESADSAEEPSTRQGGGGRDGSELPKSAYETSTDRRRNKYANWSAVAMLLAGVGGAAYYGRNWDTDEEEIAHPDAPSGWEIGLLWKRIQARWSNQLSYYTEPTFPQLLPTADPAPPYTLVLSLEDLLIHSEWSREHGWRTAKRPGLDYFLRYLVQYYEIVVFTSLPANAAEPIIRKLDPLRLTIMWPLFREATRYENGEYIKDLSYLNRDLSRTILIDTKNVHAKNQPENAIILPGWDGKPQDKGLVNLIPFLEYIAAMGIPDVRQAIKSFEGKDIPIEFARREAIQREAFNKQLAEEQAKQPRRSASTWVTNALGIRPQGGLQFEEGQSIAQGRAQGKMLGDQARERGQKTYEAMEKEIRENSDKWMKELEAAEKEMQEEMMKGMKSKVSFSSIFGFGGQAGVEGSVNPENRK